MAIVDQPPQAERIIRDVVKALKATGKEAGSNYRNAPDRVIRTGGISPNMFVDSTFDMLYFVVVPEERSQPESNQFFTSFMELFVVGAKRGEWSEDPFAQISPTREEEQQEVAADIKRAMLVDFRRDGNAHNTDLTNTRFMFIKWPKFAIVQTRWEIEFDWNFEDP